MLIALHNRAGALLLGGDQWGAAEGFQRVAARRLRALGPHHADTLGAMRVLAHAMGEPGRAAAAGRLEGLQSWLPVS